MQITTAQRYYAAGMMDIFTYTGYLENSEELTINRKLKNKKFILKRWLRQTTKSEKNLKNCKVNDTSSSNTNKNKTVLWGQ